MALIPGMTSGTGIAEMMFFGIVPNLKGLTRGGGSMQVMGSTIEVNHLTYKEYSHSESWDHEDSHSDTPW